MRVSFMQEKGEKLASLPHGEQFYLKEVYK
jgi:hypothetical protein